MKYAVMITGHRPDKLDGYQQPYGPVSTKVYHTLHTWLVENRSYIRHAITGMAQGVDTIFAEACIAADVPFVAAVPFVGQEARWPLAAQERYRHVLAAGALAVEAITDPPPAHYEAAVHALRVRNAWMVDHADVGIAVWNGSHGGTTHAARLLRAANKLLWRIDPTAL